MASDAQASAAPSTSELLSLLDGLATSVLWLDSDCVIQHINEPAEGLFGLSRKHAAGHTARELLGNNTDIEKVILRALASGAQCSRRELPFVRGGSVGRLRYVDVTATPFDPPGYAGGVSV